MNEANKAFLFGINYITMSDDEDYRDELEEMFEVSYHSAEKLKQKVNYSPYNSFFNIYFPKVVYQKQEILF